MFNQKLSLYGTSV